MGLSDVGGGVAPGRRGTTVRKAKVRLVPWWVPWDQNNKGAWRLLPADTTHSVQYIDEHNQQTPAYVAKGFIPEAQAQQHIPALVEKAKHAVKASRDESLPPPDWAVGVLARYEKVSAGADAA